MKDPLGVSPSKGNQCTTRGKEKILLTSVGIEPTTSGLDLPLCTSQVEASTSPPGHLTPFLAREGGNLITTHRGRVGNLITSLDVMFRDKSWYGGGGGDVKL